MCKKTEGNDKSTGNDRSGECMNLDDLSFGGQFQDVAGKYEGKRLVVDLGTSGVRLRRRRAKENGVKDE